MFLELREAGCPELDASRCAEATSGVTRIQLVDAPMRLLVCHTETCIAGTSTALGAESPVQSPALVT